MISNRVKRNIWLTLTILSVGVVIDRTIRVFDGSVDWWNLVTAICILVICTKFYLCYRRQVKAGNLFGKINPLK